MNERFSTRLRSFALRSVDLIVLFILIAAAACVPIGAALGLL